MKKYKTIIVDDEPSAREGARQVLKKDPELTVIGEYGNGADAAVAIINDAPEIVILDIQMPDLDGFGCIELLDPAARPEVVFLTAHEEYARKAFDVDAADYVLKPFSDLRFLDAMDRAKRRALAKSMHPQFLTRLVARYGDVMHVIAVEDIEWIEGADYYARLHCGSTSHLVRQPLSRLLKQLDPKKFIRVHRSVIVNVDRIKRVLRRGDFGIELNSGKHVPVSRRFWPRVNSFFKNTDQ